MSLSKNLGLLQV